jgi:hypothetical protein
MLSIFLPIRLGNNFIIKQNILIIYITEYSFSADLVQAQGKHRTVLKSIFHMFDEYRNIYDVEYLHSMMSKLVSNWEHDSARIILPSNIIIFRSLQSPFDDIEKIKMTAPFELESLLPFSLSEAAIDVIYQNKIKNQETNKILASVTKEEFLNIYREACHKAGIKMASVSIDTIEIAQYILYHMDIQDTNFVVMYKNLYHSSFLLFNKTTLLGIKTITIDKNNEENYSTLAERSLILLAEENKIDSNTLAMYTLNMNESDNILSIIREKYTSIKVQAISGNTIIQNSNKIQYKNEITTNGSTNPGQIIFNSLWEENDIFNLAHKELNEAKNKILFKQIIVGFLLTGLLVIFFFSMYAVQNYHIQSSLKKTENEGIAYLKKEFSLGNKDSSSLDVAIKEAKKIIGTLENNLPTPVIRQKFLFVNTFTKLVQNLSETIQGLIIHEIKWKLKTQDQIGDSLFLIGEVKDFDSLHLLEESLKKSNLFTNITPQQDLQFNFHLFIVNQEQI